LLPNFKDFDKFFLETIDRFKFNYDAKEPEKYPLPEPWEYNLTTFERILIIKALRPDKVIPALQNWISQKLGQKFIEPLEFNINDCYQDSDVTTPMIFVLSPGSDPLADFLKFAEEKGYKKKCEQISLGQGQGPQAERMINDYAQIGGWVLLQNCHLAASWMPNLQKICNGLQVGENVKREFRLWLTSAPTLDFPVQILQNGIKMTLEPPRGLKANLLMTYKDIDDRELEDSDKPKIYKKLLYGFAMFHAIILERKKFGPIGWNIPYEFTEDDFRICQRQLKIFLDESKDIPYKVLNFLGAEINYGGRVTDDKDLRLIKSTLKTFITREAILDTYKYSESGIYCSPKVGDHLDYIKHIKSLPLDTTPEVFGLHENANIVTGEESTRTLLSTILLTQPRTFVTKTHEMSLNETINVLENKTPKLFPLELIQQKYPTNFHESMNTVLVQEIIRYNRLLEIIPLSLDNLKQAIKGEIVMSEELELMAKSLNENQVPEIWKAKSFLSLKSLASWMDDLKKRVEFLNSWVENGAPKAFWASGFFFPQAFFTGVLQNYARKQKIAIDKLSFDFRILDHLDHLDIENKPEEGCYIYGMFLEGARWDSGEHILAKSLPKELYTDLPLMWILPMQNKQPSQGKVYHCPIYKVLSRAGTLSTTGHSTNFVMYSDIPSNEPEEVWIKAGVAAFLSLR